MQRLLTALFSEVTDVAEHQKDLDKMYSEIKAEDVKAVIEEQPEGQGTDKNLAPIKEVHEGASVKPEEQIPAITIAPSEK